MNVAIYLRKSRADLEAEARGEGETLSKHKNALYKLAREKELNIIKIYEEIVSGESIMHRPEMIKLLQDVEKEKYDAVLVMDMDRLGRGDMQDQGLILSTFKQSKTKIITPRKTYDLDNEFDEEYTEFETFMARRELKMITRRMQRGRISSIESGNYIGTNPPYGYKIKELPDGRTLEPISEQAQVVKLIYEWYTNDDYEKRIGSAHIANKLNQLGYKTSTGRQWADWGVLNILKNAVYAGRIQWKKSKSVKSSDPSKKNDKSTRPKEEWIDVEGKHEPIISMEVYQKAQEILKNRYHVPYQIVNGITNPLAGLVICGKCGKSMVLRPYKNQKDAIKCYNGTRCDNKMSNVDLVEERILNGLKQWLENYKITWEMEDKIDKSTLNTINLKKKAISKLEKEKVDLEKQKNKLHDLLEREIYNEETFLTRSNELKDRTNKIETAMEDLIIEINLEENREKTKKEIIPKVEQVLTLYDKTDDPKLKNGLLKSVIEKTVYTKEKNQWRDEFTLVLYPILPNQ